MMEHIPAMAESGYENIGQALLEDSAASPGRQRVAGLMGDAMVSADRRIDALAARFPDRKGRMNALMRRIADNAREVDTWLASIPR